jgi:hypothetical protein
MLMLALALAAAQPPPQRPQMLLLGSPHLANNNRDIVKTAVPDVRTPERQREIEAVVTALARFRPTRVAVEWGTKNQAKLDQRYAAYRAGTYTLSANEIDQIALRLAARLGLERVDAVDWLEEPPMPEVEYDWSVYAPRHGMQGQVDAISARGQTEGDAEDRDKRCTNIAAWYRALNTAAMRASLHRPYFDYAMIGGEGLNPGATWVGNWYTRNLRIFTNLRRIAKPDDRVMVLYGAGHAHLLDQFARESGAFTLADPLAYLPAGARKRGPECR